MLSFPATAVLAAVFAFFCFFFVDAIGHGIGSVVMSTAIECERQLTQLSIIIIIIAFTTA